MKEGKEGASNEGKGKEGGEEAKGKREKKPVVEKPDKVPTTLGGNPELRSDHKTGHIWRIDLFLGEVTGKVN